MLPSGLSMLWEAVEPTQALQGRFGFGGFTAASGWVSGLLDEAWGITALDCTRIVISGENAIVWTNTSRGRLVMKWSRAESRFAALTASARLLSHLGRRGLPVATPIPALTGQDRITVDGPLVPLSVAVQPELSGDWLDVADGVAVRAAGACLARLHEELRAYHDERLPTTSRINVSMDAIQRWLADGDSDLAPGASSRLGRLAVGLPDLDREPQLVHHDYRAANILTSASTIVGVLDFDEVAVGQPVGDLAHASVYLATLFTSWGPTPTAARQQLRAGYESVRALTPAEGRWYDALVLWLAIQAIPGKVDPGAWAAALAP
jgi:homoserine kinase type II